MRLYALKLYQRILFALTVLLLVMNLEQVWCNAQNAQKNKFMYNKLSHKYVTMHNNGTVSTTAKENGMHWSHQCMRYCTVKKGPPILLSIYNPGSRRYLCYNKAKMRLVGMRKLSPNCYFTETSKNSYFVYTQYRRKLSSKYPSTDSESMPVLAFKKSGKLKPSWERPLKSSVPDAELFLTQAPKDGECAFPARDTECPDAAPLRHQRHRNHPHRPPSHSHPRSPNNV